MMAVATVFYDIYINLHDTLTMLLLGTMQTLLYVIEKTGNSVKGQRGAHLSQTIQKFVAFYAYRVGPHHTTKNHLATKVFLQQVDGFSHILLLMDVRA
jgi:hypothetical protein